MDNEQLKATKLLGESLRLFFAKIGILLPLAALPFMAAELLTTLLFPGKNELTFGPDAMAGENLSAVLWIVFIELLAGYAVIAVVAMAVADILSGTRRGLESYLTVILRNIVPLVVLGVLVAVLTGIALLAFILPGLYVMAQFYVLPACIIFEGTGMAALGRAQSLSSGYRWSILGGLLILGVFFIGIGMMLGAFHGLLANSSGMGALFLPLMNVLINSVTSCVSAIFMVFVYARLREIKEGVGIEDISSGQLNR